MSSGDFTIISESDGQLVFRNDETGEEYISGETLIDFGVENLSYDESLALGLDPTVIEISDPFDDEFVSYEPRGWR